MFCVTFVVRDYGRSKDALPDGKPNVAVSGRALEHGRLPVFVDGEILGSHPLGARRGLMRHVRSLSVASVGWAVLGLSAQSGPAPQQLLPTFHGGADVVTPSVPLHARSRPADRVMGQRRILQKSSHVGM